METIDDTARVIARDISGEFESRLRAELADKEHEWLVDQIVRLVLQRHNLADTDDAAEGERKRQAREARRERARRLGLDAAGVHGFVSRNRDRTRDQLIADGLLKGSAPAKGTAPISPDERSEAGEALLVEAKDMLFTLLFGDQTTNTRLDRVQHELLTLALPRHKAAALDFMRASTELAAVGTWQDPDSVSNDERADNVLLEVQFGETADEVVGNAIVVALTLINNLEINEQVLYARMINIEETTLIS